MSSADTAGEDAPVLLSTVEQDRNVRSNYGSDGETDHSPGRLPINTEVSDGDNIQEENLEAEDGHNTENEEDEDKQCGVVYVGRKFLALLPSIGDDEEEGTAEFEEALRTGAKQVIQLIIPVTTCMIVVLICQLTIAANYTGPQQQLYYLPLHESDSNQVGINFLIGLLNAVVFVTIVIIMTILLVFLFKYRCYKAIYVWLLVASAILLFMISSTYFIEIMVVRKLVIDWFTFIFLIWNFGVMGLMVIHWKGPLRLQQGYLVLTSALVATVLIKYLPDWTAWIILAAISVYDLFAVLCPKGPLRILVETAKERGEPIFPSLIYSSTMVWVGMADVEDKKNKKGQFPKGRPEKTASTSPAGSPAGEAEESSDGDEDSDGSTRLAAARGMAHRENSDERNREGATDGGDGPTDGGDGPKEEEEDDEPRGFKLGLGDFIFYSVLVGKAASDSNGDWVIISSCFVAILVGLCMTSLILGIVRRALPALPISIFFGLIFYFSSQYLISPFVEVLDVHQVFI